MTKRKRQQREDQYEQKPYRLTPEEIEALRKDAKEADELFDKLWEMDHPKSQPTNRAADNTKHLERITEEK